MPYYFKMRTFLASDAPTAHISPVELRATDAENIKNKCYASNIENNGGIGFQTGLVRSTMLKKYGTEHPNAK